MENNKRKTPSRKRTSDDAPKGKISIKEAVDAMYYHTAKANTVYYWMVAAILILAPRNSTPIILALVALLLGLAQNLWQGVTLELFVRYLNGKGDKSFSDGLLLLLRETQSGVRSFCPRHNRALCGIHTEPGSAKMLVDLLYASAIMRRMTFSQRFLS